MSDYFLYFHNWVNCMCNLDMFWLFDPYFLHLYKFVYCLQVLKALICEMSCLMLRSHLSAIRYERRDGPFAELYRCFKFRYEVLRVHTFWYDLFRLDAICQLLVTRSVTKESPVQIRSRTIRSNMMIPIKCRIITIGVPDLARSNTFVNDTTRSSRSDALY